jgi:cystathionine beta-lyase
MAMSGDHPRWLELEELRRRRSEKWRAYPPEVLPAFVAEMDISLSAPITEALNDAVARGDTGYAFPDPALAEAVSAHHARRFGWVHDPAAVALIPDVMTGVSEVLRRALPPGSGVVVNTPVYPPFFHHVEAAGCRVVEAPLARHGSGYVMDLEALEAAFRDGAAAYLLCNPHNPVGLVPTTGELRRIAALAESHAVLVLADEIHASLVMAGARHVPYLWLEEARPRGIAFVSASKGWNLPGLKCAQLVTASEPMRAIVARLPEELTFAASNLGVMASIAAYREGGPWLDELLLLLDENRGLLASLLAGRLPAVRYAPPQATYLAWLDCTSLDLSAEPAQVFLERGRVALRPGPDFGSGGRGFVRVTIATSAAILTEIVDRMLASLGGSDGT